MNKTTIYGSNTELLTFESPTYDAWQRSDTSSKTNVNGSSVSINFTGTTLQAFGRTRLQSILYTQDSPSTSNSSISAYGKGLNNTILSLSGLRCTNHTVGLIVVNLNVPEQGANLTIGRFEYTPCTPNITPAQPSIPFTPIVPSETPAAQSTSSSTSSASSSSSSSNDTAKTVGIAVGCVLGALLILSVAGLLWCCRRHRMRQKKPPSASFLVLSSSDLPPYIPPSARSKYAPAADSRALFSVEVVAPSRDEKSELPAPATRPVEGTSGAAYLRGYLPDSKEWLRNAERARVAAAAAAAAAQSAHGEPGGHAAAYEGGIAGGYGERPVV